MKLLELENFSFEMASFVLRSIELVYFTHGANWSTLDRLLRNLAYDQTAWSNMLSWKDRVGSAMLQQGQRGGGTFNQLQCSERSSELTPGFIKAMKTTDFDLRGLIQSERNRSFFMEFFLLTASARLAIAAKEQRQALTVLLERHADMFPAKDDEALLVRHANRSVEMALLYYNSVDLLFCRLGAGPSTLRQLLLQVEEGGSPDDWEGKV